MKMAKRIEKLLVLILAGTVCGCQSGLYKISTSEDGEKLDSKMSYSDVSTLSTEMEFDLNRMPVEIVHGQEKRMPDEGGVSGVLWLFTLGIFPMVQTEYVAQDITVKTPIGVKSGTWRVDAKRWIGWVPLFIGYPSLADERDADAKLPNLQMERKAKDKLVDSLAREFSYDAYVSFANNKNKERKSECDHIAEVRQKINGLMAENKYDAAEQLRLREAVIRAGTWACDAAVWQELAEKIAEKKRIADRKAELERIATSKKKINEMLANNQFDKAFTLCDVELERIATSKKKINEILANQFDEAFTLYNADSGERLRLLDADKEIWEGLKQTIVDKKEDYRVANKKFELEKLFTESKFQDVVAGCNQESDGAVRHATIWAELKSKAEIAISERDRKIELARIGNRKKEVETLLWRKDYKAVIMECAKETGRNAGSRPEDADIWLGLSNQAKQAQDKIDRDTELSRIEQKVSQMEKWLEDKDYDSIVAACNEEHGTNPGSRPEDKTRWDTYRSKALGLRLLQKMASRDKAIMNIKGFSLGMSMEEVEILMSYHFPSMPYARDGNQIRITGRSMVFCQTENDRVVKLSFNRDMLDKLLEYDAQTLREWATDFAHQYGMDFRGTSVHDRKSYGNATISVSQDCYVNRDRKKNIMVTIFGEQDVLDYNKDPEEIKKEAEAEVMQMMFSGVNDNSFAYNLGMRYGRMANNVEKVRKWLKEEYVNGKGAEDGSLRIEVLK